MREKLIELLRHFDEFCVTELNCENCAHKHYDDCEVNARADYLIANGVTIAKDNNVPSKWISVKDRLPEEECRCLVIDAAGDIEMDCYDGKGRFVLDRSGAVQHPSHWMPLPQPPKGE